MRVVGSCVATLFVAVIGCVGESDSHKHATCISENPPKAPFDVGDVPAVSPAPGSGLPTPEPINAATIGAECLRRGGSGCDPASFISKAAALCIATEYGFEAGIAPWRVALTYHSGHQRVVWNVTNTLSGQGSGGFAGEILTVDATEGKVLRSSGYVATP